MPGFAVALTWMVVSPFALITDITAVVVCLHYRPGFHSCDVAFISIFVTMATSSALLFPIPAIIRLGDLSWNKQLCLFSTWLSIALRTSHLLVLLVLNVYWVASLRMSPKGRMFISAKPMKASVGACWVVSALVGLPAVAGGSQLFPIFQDDVCNFLPANVHVGYAVFFIILSLVSVIMGFISSLDTILVLGSMRQAATSRFRAAGIHAPTFSGGAGWGTQAHSKYNELNVSIELCRLVLCFSVASAAMDALPLLVSQFLQLTQKPDLETLEVVWLWLLLMESLTLPHVLWALSRRYRHAATYTWRVFVLRDQGAVEADSTCSLQAFRMKVKEADDMLRVRSLQENRNRSRSSIPEVNSYMTERKDDDTSTANDNRHDIVDEENNMTTTDSCLTLSTQTTPPEIVVHGNWRQDIRNISCQGQNTSLSPLTQGASEGLSNVPSSVFAIADTHTNQAVVYENQHTALTTFTYGLKKPVEMSTSRIQIQKLNKQNTPNSTVMLLNSALNDNDTGKNTVSQGNNIYSRNDVSTICDTLDNACIHKSTHQNCYSCNHISTQLNTVCNARLDCLNNEFTDFLIQKIFLNKRTETVSSDAGDKNQTLNGVSSNVNSQIINPHWVRVGNLSTRNQINNRPITAYPAPDSPAVCCGRTNLLGQPAIDVVNQNTGDVQQKPYILMKKYTIVLGVYYDDTHSAENNETSERLRALSGLTLNTTKERSSQAEPVAI